VLSVTLGAIWCNDEEPGPRRLWMATDSRISDDEGKLIDEGIKLYELPIVCRSPGPSRFYDSPFFTTAVGMAGAGGSLVYQHVCGTLVPILGNLIGAGTAVPSMADIASLTSAVTTRYVRSLGEWRPSGAYRVTLVVGGESAEDGPEAYKLSPHMAEDGLLAFVAEPLDLETGVVHFIGDRIEDARAMLDDLAERNEPGAPRHRVALNVIRAFIDDPRVPTIGGDVQIGYTTGRGFRRVASVIPDRTQPEKALRLLNSIDLDALPPVGPCAIGIDGMVSP
jgi:hypothetical protein